MIETKILNSNTHNEFSFFLNGLSIDTVTLQTIDILGNISNKCFRLVPKEDINGDGIVTLDDITEVVGRFGQAGENIADVDENGVVDAGDILLVARALDEQNVNSLSLLFVSLKKEEIQRWITLAYQQRYTSDFYQQVINFLKSIVTDRLPKCTLLLPNYPNPFNPDTRLPYQLAEPAVVTLNICATALWSGLCCLAVNFLLYEQKSCCLLEWL